MKPRLNRRRLALLALVLVAASSVIAAAFRGGRSPKPLPPPGIEAKAWFNTPRPITLAELRGRPVLIEYWGTWCPPCLKAVPLLKVLQSRYGPRGLVIIAATADPPEKVRDYVRRFDMSYLVAAGASDRTMQPAPHFPHTVLHNADGSVRLAGSLEEARVALENWDWRASGERADLVVPGAATAEIPDRPADARQFTQADRAIVEEELFRNARRAPLTREELDRLFAFYWRNLPHSDWPGDAEVRGDASKTLGALLRSEQMRDQAIEEWRRRLIAGEPDAFVRRIIISESMWLETTDDDRVLQLLKHHATHEPNPTMRSIASFYLMQLKGAPAEDDESESKEFNQFYWDYQNAKESFRGRWFGVPKRFAAAWENEKRIQECYVQSDPTETARRLMSLYEEYRNSDFQDSFNRSEVLVALFFMPRNYSDLPQTLRIDVQRFLLRALESPHAGNQERGLILGNMSGFGMESFTLERLTPILDRFDRENPGTRVGTDTWRIRLTNPETLNAPCPPFKDSPAESASRPARTDS